MSIEEKRQAWEMDKWIWKWIAIGTGVVGAIMIFLTAYLEQIGIFDLIVVLIIAGGIGQVIYLAVDGLLVRLRTDMAERHSHRNRVLAAGFVVVLLLIIGQAYAGFPGFFSYFVVGAAAVAFGNSFVKYKSVLEPRAFVQIENDANVLELKRGQLLLDGLEAAGYRILTQCGAKGDCASCRVNLREVNQPITPENYGPVLTPRQQNEGWVISCKLPVENDMVVRLYKPVVLRWPGFNRHEMSQKARALRTALPGFDCEACGYKTCDQYAVAISSGEAGTTDCLPGGEAVSQRLDGVLRDAGSSGEMNASRTSAEVSNA